MMAPGVALELLPVSLREANSFVLTHHRHHEGRGVARG
jgi:hypothetical protein